MNARLGAGAGEVIDRSRQIPFDFEGRKILAHPGDTVASAVLSTGQTIFSRTWALVPTPRYSRASTAQTLAPARPAIIRLQPGPFRQHRGLHQNGYANLG